MSDIKPRRRDPPFRKKLGSNEDHMENSITLRRSNHQILHEKPEFMFNSLTESLKTVSQERDVETDARRQSQEATTLMSERSPQQSRETTLKATRLFRQKRCKTSLKSLRKLRENQLNKTRRRNSLTTRFNTRTESRTAKTFQIKTPSLTSASEIGITRNGQIQANALQNERSETKQHNDRPNPKSQKSRHSKQHTAARPKDTEQKKPAHAEPKRPHHQNLQE
jgi:hypothetical protein